MGAWIETCMHTNRDKRYRSHPMWVRGLKQNSTHKAYYVNKVAPHVGAWIETVDTVLFEHSSSSHPMWVRGLKPLSGQGICAPDLSHPMWVRGLKLTAIEYDKEPSLSHPMWVRGLKHLVGSCYELLHKCRTPCGCVD